MATKFVSGRVKFDVSYNDRTSNYKVRMCVREPGQRAFCNTQYVGNPAIGPTSAHGRRIGVDDPRAMMDAARAAVAFADDDGAGIGEHVDYDRRLTHVVVRPARRKRRR